MIIKNPHSRSCCVFCIRFYIIVSKITAKCSCLRITFWQIQNNYEIFSPINSDLVYTGIILHDIGKVKEFSINYGIPVRNQGYGLIGHFSLGEEIILKYVRMIKSFPEDLEWKLRHIILSHHGRKEYGSSVEPQIPEAEIIYHLDSLDANYKKINFL